MTRQTTRDARPLSPAADWLMRILKGALVGIGFILPGFSGGVMAVILGLYDRILRFLANPRASFRQNVRFFIPVFTGFLIGVWLFAVAVTFAFENYAAIFTCLFIGFVLGTLPSLFRTARSRGWAGRDVAAMIVAAAVIFVLMMFGDRLPAIQPSVPIWFIAGALIGLGVIVPGLSPSNFLMYFKLYDKMTERIKALDLTVIIPIGLGALVCVLALAKLVAWVLNRRYALMYHIILGTVIGSSLALFPKLVLPAFSPSELSQAGLSAELLLLFCLLALALGTLLSWLFSRLEDKYPRQELFG